MNKTTQTTEKQNLAELKDKVVDRIRNYHPELDTSDERTLLQAVYDDYDENEVLHDIYTELVATMEQEQAQRSEREQAYDANLNNTIAAIEKMKQDDGVDAEAVDLAVAWLQRVGDEAAQGRVTPEDILLVMKGTTYEADLAAADREGEVRGRNYVIDEHLRTRKPSPDTPSLGISGGMPPTLSAPSIPLGALASTARPTIWERGRERRYSS